MSSLFVWIVLHFLFQFILSLFLFFPHIIYRKLYLCPYYFNDFCHFSSSPILIIYLTLGLNSYHIRKRLLQVSQITKVLIQFLDPCRKILDKASYFVDLLF